MKDGFTLVAHKNHVNFAKNNEHICVAKLDSPDGLVKFLSFVDKNPYDVLSEEYLSSAATLDARNDSLTMRHIPPVRLEINTAHLKWGHCGEGMLRRTAKSHSIELFGTLQQCEACILTKSNQSSKKKFSSLLVNDVLEVVPIDLQGPFHITAINLLLYQKRLCKTPVIIS